MSFMRIEQITSSIFDMVLHYDVLLLCVSGFSIKEISQSTKLDEEDVVSACRRLLKFDGWVIGLDYNPWFFYKDLTKREKYGIIEDEDLEEITKGLCERFDKIRKELDEHYG